MADIKISALTDGGEALGTDDVLVVRAGANRRVRPAVPLGPYASAAALQAAKPASVALAGRVASVGSAAPYVRYHCDGAAWVPSGAGSSITNIVPGGGAPTTSYQVNGVTHNITYPSSTVTVDVGGGVTTTITRDVSGNLVSVVRS